jgi:hypothetical protein
MAVGVEYLYRDRMQVTVHWTGKFCTTALSSEVLIYLNGPKARIASLNKAGTERSFR